MLIRAQTKNSSQYHHSISDWFFLVLIIMYPMIFMIGRNYYLYTIHQLGATLGAALVSSSVGAGLLVLAARGTARAVCGISPDWAAWESKLSDLLIGATGMTICLILLYIPIRKMLSETALVFIFYVLTLALFALWSAIAGLRPAILIFAILIPLNLITTGLSIFRAQWFPHPAPKPAPAAFRSRPNIYLVVLESYNSLRLRRETYGIDNSLIEKSLQQHQFTTYENTYANYYATLASVSSLFQMDHHYYRDAIGVADGTSFRKIIGGTLANPALLALQDNGYRIDFSSFPSSLYHASCAIDHYTPQCLLQPLELFPGIKVLANFFFGFDVTTTHFARFVIQATTPAIVDIHPRSQGRRPTFSLIYAGAGHSPNSENEFPDAIRKATHSTHPAPWVLNQTQNFWKRTYRNLTQESDTKLVKMIDDLCQSDPGAVIILLGDHGAWLNRDRWVGPSADPNRNIRNNGSTPKDVTRDLFEVFLAIRWPSPHLKRPITPVNLMHEVFAFLAGSEAGLGPWAADNSYVYLYGIPYRNSRVITAVQDGVPLVDWNPYHENSP